MSFPRLAMLVLPVAVGLPLLTGACGTSLAVSAAGYGADGVALAETNKTMADHLASMVSKKDCALWRMFRNQHVCRARDGDRDPYDVDYTQPFRNQGEGGVTEYMPPPHAAADAPPVSWDPRTYASPTAGASHPAALTATADSQTTTPVARTIVTTAASPATASPSTPQKDRAVKHATAKRKRLRKEHAPNQAARRL